jgi:hypothetical protein
MSFQNSDEIIENVGGSLKVEPRILDLYNVMINWQRERKKGDVLLNDTP